MKMKCNYCGRTLITNDEEIIDFWEGWHQNCRKRIAEDKLVKMTENEIRAKLGVFYLEE